MTSRSEVQKVIGFLKDLREESGVRRKLKGKISPKEVESDAFDKLARALEGVGESITAVFSSPTSRDKLLEALKAVEKATRKSEEEEKKVIEDKRKELFKEIEKHKKREAKKRSVPVKIGKDEIIMPSEIKVSIEGLVKPSITSDSDFITRRAIEFGKESGMGLSMTGSFMSGTSS